MHLSVDSDLRLASSCARMAVEQLLPRLRCRVGVQCWIMIAPRAGVCSGSVIELSPLGVTLICRQCCRSDQLILIELVTPENTSTWPIAAEIRDSRCLPDGFYQVNCTFLRPLTERQFEALTGKS
jgi:hypothetical protein